MGESWQTGGGARPAFPTSLCGRERCRKGHVLSLAWAGWHLEAWAQLRSPSSPSHSHLPRATALSSASATLTAETALPGPFKRGL